MRGTTGVQCRQWGGRVRAFPLTALLALAVARTCAAQSVAGPFNAVFLQGGVGISHPLGTDSPTAKGHAPWSLGGWLRVDAVSEGTVVIAARGLARASQSDRLVLEKRLLALRLGDGHVLRSTLPLAEGEWHAVAAVFDGTRARLYLDGREVSAASGTTADVEPVLQLAPEDPSDPTGSRHFGGALADFSLRAAALSGEEARTRAAQRPDMTLVAFNHVGAGWPWQEHAWRGLLEPQPAWTLPRGHTPTQPPVSHPPSLTPAVRPLTADSWQIAAWRLTTAAEANAPPERISRTGFDDSQWLPAVVPGTVLSTLIANGRYPDPDYGLNNLAIPESLARQDYWYRSVFTPPQAAPLSHYTLTFNGINYAAEVWLNGTRVGGVRGAFIRGVFDVSALLRQGEPNVLAVRISPPPHPGIPHEQSVAAGPGENGGNLALDGPTFIATEGWDWIPGIRDRDTGLWQDVTLHASGALRLLDPQVTTTLPLPRTDSADVALTVPIENTSSATVRALLQASFGDVQVRREALLPPGVTVLHLTSAEQPALRVAHPRLWWPNGYGEPELYTLQLQLSADGHASDEQQLRFGIRQLTYELSLFDQAGRLRRVLIDPTMASAHGERLVDMRHAALKRTANGWAASLTSAGETSAAVQPVGTTALSPYLVIRVNGVPIAARGGSWGMDDSRKRSSREHLEPFFRLHRAAHLNIIRNWLGQNTEEVFYTLADEYGLLVLNDFWESTQDFQVEAEDPQLFLANAADVMRRFRNHPSIALWFGRNEGMPQPILNEGLAELDATLDGTRYYSGSSNRVNLQDSGPYNYRAPQEYFTTLAAGFAVELGTPSFASLETLKSYVPAADRWPLADTYAYHDWHFGGNGDTASFSRALQRQLGAATDLEDFERKAQLLDYVAYRAIFEGFQAGLWTRNSARLLWMTHPAWPSNTWQIYSSDYDTAGAFYGVAHACEPLHVQLNLPDLRPAVVNTTRTARPRLTLLSEVLTLQGRQLASRRERLDAPENAVSTLAPLDLAAILARERLVFVRLTLSDEHGALLSRNLYWQAAAPEEEQQLAGLPRVRPALQARATRDGTDALVQVDISNRSNSPLLQARLIALDAAGERVLPAYYSDNYVTLLPGDSQRLEVRCPLAGSACASIAVRGWNVEPLSAPVRGTP